MYKIPVLFILILLCTSLQGQKYAPVEKYLVDSLELDRISDPDKILIDSALMLYRDCPNDTCRANSISIIVEGSWDDEVWPKYNLWILNYAANRIDKAQDSLSWYQLQRHYASSLNNIGYLFNSKGEVDSALAYYDKCLKIQEEIGDLTGISATLINTGYIFLNQGLIEKTLENYYASLKIEEELQNQSGIATALNGIGYIQYRQGDSRKALDSYTKSLNIREKLKEKYGIATCLNNIGLIFKDQEDWVKALSYYQKGLELERELVDKSGIAISLGNIGFVYNSLGDEKKALEYYTESLNIRKELQDKLGVSQSLNSIADIKLSNGDLKSARTLAQKSLKIAKELDYPKYIRDAAQILGEIAKKKKNWKESLKYFELYTQMRDSIFNEETVTASIHRQYQYSYEKKILADSIENANQQKIKQAELAALEAQKKQLDTLTKQQRQQSYFLIFGIFSTVVFSALIYNRMRAVRKQKKVIEKQNDKLKEQKKDLEYLNEDLEEFAHIVSHDLKNPLHVISALSQLIEEDFPNLEKGVKDNLKLIKESSQESNALIDGVLEYSEAGRKAVSFASVDINALLDSTIQQIRNQNGVAINITSTLPILTCNEYQFYQILSNLISNAIKYNDKEKNEGQVTIDYALTPAFHEFTITDNGPGIPKNLQPKVFDIFQKTTDSKGIDSSGIGLSIVKKLVTQNGGDINLTSEEGRGSSFKFTWPI